MFDSNKKKEEKVKISNRAKWTKFQNRKNIIDEVWERAEPRGRTSPIKAVN